MINLISHLFHTRIKNLNKNALKREEKRLKTCSIQVVKHAIRRLEFIDFSYNLCWFFFSLANSKTTITFKRQKNQWHLNSEWNTKKKNKYGIQFWFLLGRNLNCTILFYICTVSVRTLAVFAVRVVCEWMFYLIKI